MDLHVKILAAFHLILGVLGLMGSLMVVLLFGGAAGIIRLAAANDPDAWIAVPIVGLVGSMLVMFIFTLSVPGIIAGYGLSKRRPWARIFTIVLSVINLINIPSARSSASMACGSSSRGTPPGSSAQHRSPPRRPQPRHSKALPAFAEATADTGRAAKPVAVARPCRAAEPVAAARPCRACERVAATRPVGEGRLHTLVLGLVGWVRATDRLTAGARLTPHLRPA